MENPKWGEEVWREKRKEDNAVSPRKKKSEPLMETHPSVLRKKIDRD